MKRHHASLLLAAITLIAYLPALRGGFIWDDDDYVTNNANLRSFAGLGRIWLDPRATPQYYPLVHTTFWIEHQLWGLSAPGYHVVNVLLHAGGAILLWRVLALLELPGAFIAACLFAVHPINVESVAWVTERKNVLSGVFYFASALAYLRWVQSDSKRWGGYAGALALFIAALLSKTVTCSLPAALLLVLWWKRGTLTRTQFLSFIPMFIVGGGLAYLTVTLERDWVRAAGPDWDYSLVDRVLIAGRAIWFYVTKLILPVGLSFVYPKWDVDPRAAWQWAFPVGVLVAIFVLWQMRDRWGRGPLAAALIFVGTLFPALGFFNVYPMRYTFVADHYAYHATVAALALIACAFARSPRPATVVAMAALMLLTMLRAAKFRDSEPLWRDTLAKNPDSWMVNLNLARVLNKRGQRPESWQLFARLVKIAPNVPEAHWNYGSSLAQQGLVDEAVAAYTKAIQLGGDPLPQVYRLRGEIFAEQGKREASSADFLSAATEMARLGQLEAARADFDRAVQIDPSLEPLRHRILRAPTPPP